MAEPICESDEIWFHNLYIANTESTSLPTVPFMCVGVKKKNVFMLKPYMTSQCVCRSVCIFTYYLLKTGNCSLLVRLVVLGIKPVSTTCKSRVLPEY